MHDDEVVGALALEDEIRPEAREAIEQLHALGRRVIMITGDAHQVAEAVGRDLGVDEVMSEVLPEDKDAEVAALQARGLSVAMVGDGVNDAPALARADVGIAIGAGTDVAIESADVVLASNDPRSVVSCIRLSVASYRKMVQNLAWAAGYNVVAIPLAAGAFAWAGSHSDPKSVRVLDESLDHRRRAQRTTPPTGRPAGRGVGAMRGSATNAHSPAQRPAGAETTSE